MAKKYFIITFGCQMNESDSERLGSSLEKKNYKPALKMNEADLIVVNMCSVRQSAVDRVFGVCQKITKLKSNNFQLKTILTGCILKFDKRKFSAYFDEIMDTKKILKHDFSQHTKNPLAYIPISNGCNYSCAYCVVPSARGRLKCRSCKDIIKETKNAIKAGKKEIWLLGQSVNDYKDGNINFEKLIKLIDAVSGKFKFFFMSPHPANFSDELINTLAKCEKFGKRLNLPLQSGDSEILKIMKRPYTAEQYKKLVQKIRHKIPDINLSTDIIVGFPNETKKQFENTAKLIRDIKFDIAYISKYSPRKGTNAFLMKDNITIQEKKKRWKILNDIISKK